MSIMKLALFKILKQFPGYSKKRTYYSMSMQLKVLVNYQLIYRIRLLICYHFQRIKSMVLKGLAVYIFAIDIKLNLLL